MAAASPTRSKRSPEGIVPRHSRRCLSRDAGRCDCRPAYQAQVWSPRDRKTIRRTFATLAEARSWRSETQTALRKGQMRAPSRRTLEEAAVEWLGLARSGIVRSRSGDRYKPSALRSYEEALRTKVLPELGRLRLSAVTRNSVQDLADRLAAEGLAPSTVRNSILPLRAIYRRAVQRAEVIQNPTEGLTLPAVRGRRERVVRPAEAKQLIEALPEADRALWATALYAGLRRGELQGLRWCDVDFEAGVIRVERSWDQREGPIAPKSRAGRRLVPLAGPLPALLATQRLRTAAVGEGPVFPGRAGKPFASGAATRRARAIWAGEGLALIGLHECRHTYAALMIAAGVNVKALSQYMGHSSITVTLDRYGHLMPGAEGEAAAMRE
ncbi:MAG: tyrosine-type recombinase/integrase [Thermoleophilaceae bacterium]